MPIPGDKIGSVTGDWKRVHGVALVPALNKGFITDGDAGNIIVFDLKTLKVTKTIKARRRRRLDPVRHGVEAHLRI